MLPRDGVINSYVLKNKDGVVTDFCSFYHLPSTVIGNDKHKIMNAVYTYYNVATSISFHELMRDALILARNSGCDVYNALDMGDNLEVFFDLQFGAGDGNLQYYVYNWKCPSMDNSDIGLVLL
jgi:glycylpeptide N-tetradecanoyltransferase